MEQPIVDAFFRVFDGLIERGMPMDESADAAVEVMKAMSPREDRRRRYTRRRHHRVKSYSGRNPGTDSE